MLVIRADTAAGRYNIIKHVWRVFLYGVYQPMALLVNNVAKCMQYIFSGLDIMEILFDHDNVWKCLSIRSRDLKWFRQWLGASFPLTGDGVSY